MSSPAVIGQKQADTLEKLAVHHTDKRKNNNDNSLIQSMMEGTAKGLAVIGSIARCEGSSGTTSWMASWRL